MKKAFILLFSLSAISLSAQQYELPSPMPREQQVKHTGFTLSYNEGYELPSWVAYQLTPEQAKATGSIKEKFAEDAMVTTGSVSVKNYKDAGFIMGQMVPVEDMLNLPKAAEETFLTSNTAPQKPTFNKNVWRKTEQLIREWAKEGYTLYVVAGPVITDAPFGSFGSDKISIPLRYYKAVLDVNGERAIGFVMSSNVASGAPKTFAVSIDELEKITGIDFFPALTDDIENKIEASKDFTKWNFKALEQ
jgi:endonuclease G